MYQSQVRPGKGSELVAQQQPKQHPSSPRSRNTIQPIHSLLHFSLFEAGLVRGIAMALAMACVMASLMACGGVSYRELSTVSGGTGTNTSTTAGLSLISCGTQSLTGSQSKTCSVYLTEAAPSKTTVTLSSSNAALKVPVSVLVPAGAKTGGFEVTSSAVQKAVAVTIKGVAGGATKTDVITLYPEAKSTASLTKVSCGTQSMTGPLTKACSVYLNESTNTSVKVTLSSSNSALQVPASVTIPGGSSTGGFTITASAVKTTQSATLTATALGDKQTDVIQLEASGTSSKPTVTLSKVSCGKQSLTGAATNACSVYLSAAATSSTKVTLSSNNVSLKVPASVTVATGATTAAFTATASAVKTTVNVTLSAVADGVTKTDVVQLDASGSQPATQHQVKLSWNAANSASVAIVGYRVYRSAPGTSYQLLNSTIDKSTSFTDSTVVGGETYDYVVKSVDSAGVESSPSNETTVAVP